MRFKQGVPNLGISIECETPDVPPDGRFHVLVQGKLIFSSTSEKKALAIYRNERDRLFRIHGRLDPPKVDREQWLTEQRVTRDIKAMRSEWLTGYGAKAKKGGRGGRGGV